MLQYWRGNSALFQFLCSYTLLLLAARSYALLIQGMNVLPSLVLSLHGYQGFFQFFCPRGGQNDIVWIIGGGGGKYISVCKACGKLGGAGGMLPWEILILDFFIRHDLVESGTVFAQT